MPLRIKRLILLSSQISSPTLEVLVGKKYDPIGAAKVTLKKDKTFPKGMTRYVSEIIPCPSINISQDELLRKIYFVVMIVQPSITHCGYLLLDRESYIFMDQFVNDIFDDREYRFGDIFIENGNSHLIAAQTMESEFSTVKSAAKRGGNDKN